MKTRLAQFPAELTRFYQETDPLVPDRPDDVSKAGTEIASIYNRKAFPDLKVTWGTYPNNLGHTDFPGCFGCHDGAHLTLAQAMSASKCRL